MILFFIIISFILFSIGIAGIAISRHFIRIIISVEIILMASTILAVTFFSYLIQGNIILLLLAIWSVAVVELIVLILFYRYMSKINLSLNVSKLSKLKG